MVKLHYPPGVVGGARTFATPPRAAVLDIRPRLAYPIAMSDAGHFADVPLLAAEVPYFRVPRDDWELVLARARQLGANTICARVPWAWHEPRRGEVDLEGITDLRRDLPGFVRLCGRLGLRVILRPGPLVGAGLLASGIPPWLLRDHPEVHALLPDGHPRRHAASGLPHACALHPAYLAAARRWMAAFSRAALPLQSPAGPVVALQVDGGTGYALPADTGPGPQLRLDYNPYVTDVLWPQWLSQMTGDRRPAEAETDIGTTADAEAIAGAGWSLVLGRWSIPHTFAPPADLDELRRYAALEAFADWCHARALAAVVGWLREDGWSVPLCHSPPVTSWQAVSAIDAPGLARAVGWLGYRAPAGEVGGGSRLSSEEYVHLAHWRPRLARTLSPAHPVFVAETSAAQDFRFVAPLIGGAQALILSPLVQTQPDNPAVAARERWGMDAPLRPDGSARPRFWNAKTVFTLLGAAGADFAAARVPADVALGCSRVPERVAAWGRRLVEPGTAGGFPPEAAALRDAMAGCDHAARGQALAQRLVRAGISFDVVDLDAASPAELARYTLLLVPACGVLARATQERLVGCANLALVGDARILYDEHLAPCTLLDDAERGAPTRETGDEIACSPPEVAGRGSQPTRSRIRLPEDVDAGRVAELVEAWGGTGRHGWADAPEVDVGVRHGAAHTYVLIANRQPAPYSGTIAYRSPAGEVLHLHVNMGGWRAGAVMLLGDEVVGAAFGGDASEGGWLARGLFGSVVFNAGAGAVAPCGGGLLLTAPGSGRFQLRRREGWEGLAAHRLLLGGGLLPAAVHVEATHASLPYVAEDERGCTDLYALLPAGAVVPVALRSYLGALLVMR
ncbi:MAG TPA: beta-galactosidase, partial [Roseiflexaceae bacterium]|nr:beta-galactosidase [Roseiflexaceae bacterium]